LELPESVRKSVLNTENEFSTTVLSVSAAMYQVR